MTPIASSSGQQTPFLPVKGAWLFQEDVYSLREVILPSKFQFSISGARRSKNILRLTSSKFLEKWPQVKKTLAPKVTFEYFEERRME